MTLTGRMRYFQNGSWHVCGYSMFAMTHVILNDLPYELEGRDY